MILSGSLQQLWALIEAQQIVVLMPLFKITLPPLCSIFFGFLMQIASFDLIPIDSVIEEHGGMTPRDPINTNFESIGFESMYLLINLGTILIMIILFPVFLLILLILRLVDCYSCSSKVSEKISRNLFWNAPIKILTESFAIILMCCFINLKVLGMDTTGESISSVMTLFLLLVCLTYPLVL